MTKRLDEILIEAKALWESMTPEERSEMRRAQRRSFVRAEAGFGSDRDEAEYRAAIASGNKERIAKCEAEAQERIARAEKIMKEQEL